MSSDDSALTVQQLADLLGVNPRTVYRLAAKGMLPGFRVAGSWRFMATDVTAWILQQKHRVKLNSAEQAK